MGLMPQVSTNIVIRRPISSNCSGGSSREVLDSNYGSHKCVPLLARPAVLLRSDGTVENYYVWELVPSAVVRAAACHFQIEQGHLAGLEITAFSPPP